MSSFTLPHVHSKAVWRTKEDILKNVSGISVDKIKLSLYGQEKYKDTRNLCYVEEKFCGL